MNHKFRFSIVILVVLINFLFNLNLKAFDYSGTIGNKKIQMRLDFVGSKIEGYYFYESDGRHISLIEDTTIINKIQINEFFEDQRTGFFVFQCEYRLSMLNLTVLKGIWQNPNGTVNLPFVLNKFDDKILGKITDEANKIYVSQNKKYEDGTYYMISWDFSIEYHSENLVCLTAKAFEDGGGAHPNDQLHSMFFKIKGPNVQNLKFSDCFYPGSEERIKEIVKEYFSKSNDIDYMMDYFDVETPIIRCKGLEFICPTERHGAMNSGMINILIRYKDLKGVIREDGPLKDFVKNF